MTRNIRPRLRLENHKVTQKEEEVPEGDSMVEGMTFPRGRGRGRGGEVKYYACGKIRHMSWECPEKKKEGGGEAHILEAQRKNIEAESVEDGRSLIMKKVLLKPGKEVENPIDYGWLSLMSTLEESPVAQRFG
jgi:hypothetical protein